MNQKLWTKVLASLLVMTLTFANFILLGVYASNSYATTDSLESQTTVTNNENVTFDAYFKDESGNITHTLKEDISKEDLRMYVEVGVKKGYLKNAKIQVLGEDGTNSNLKLKSSNEALEYVETIDESSNTISLKQLDAGTQVILEIPVEAVKEDTYDLSNFSKLNDITISGTYVGDSAKEVNIQTTIQTRNEWTAVAIPTLEQELLRFIPNEIEGKESTIIQTLVRTGLENNTLPIEETKIELIVPKVNEKYPTSVKVSANGTLATNGKSEEEFKEDSYSYDAEKGNLTITVKNEAQDNKVTWLKEGNDEFVVTYIYDEKVDTIVANQNATVTIKAYNSSETVVTVEKRLTIDEDQWVGQILKGSMTTTEALSKGYLYSSSEREIPYEEAITIDIVYPELMNGLTIDQDMDYFVSQTGEFVTTVSDINYAYFKTTKISKANFEKMLGTEGSITISTLAGKYLATINKETAVDENGDYVVNYQEETNQIKIETSAPIEIGKLEVRHEKALKGNTNYTRKQVAEFVALKVEAKVKTKSESPISYDVRNIISLVEPSTKMEAQISNQNLSTVVTNENVELRVILKTDNINCDLYKNPKVEIILPNYIKQLNIKDINLLFDDELKIKDYNTYVNENGNIILTVNIEGEQTKYSGDEISKGANLIINTDITLKQLTPTQKGRMNVFITNENVTTYDQRAEGLLKGYYEVDLNAVAPVGVVTTNGVTGYNSKNETVMSISGQEQIGKLEVKKEARTATMQMNLINNYQNVINNVSILGRIPTSGNKNVDTNENFGSNIAIQMASAITASGIDASNITVYYSANQDATKDLSLASNGWTQDTSDIANMKSYLIVVAGDVATGTVLEFAYNIAIPANMEHNMQAYSNYVVYFDNVKEEGTVSEKAVSPRTGMETGNGPELQVTIRSDKEDKEVEEGQIITYTVTVQNVGKSEVKNVTLAGSIPEKAVYTWFDGVEGTQESITQEYDNSKKQYSEVIESLGVGEIASITYKVETKDLTVTNGTPEEAYIQAQGAAKVEGYDTIFTSATNTNNKLVQGFLNVTIETMPLSYTLTRRENQEDQYVITIKNVNSKAKKNVVVTDKLPDGLKFVGVDELGKYDESTNTVTWNIETLEGNSTKELFLDVITEPITSGQTSQEIRNVIQVVADGKTIEKDITTTVSKAELTIKQTSETASKEISEGDTIIYNITVENRGVGEAMNVRITDFIPDGVTYKSSQYSLNGEKNDIYAPEKESVITIPAVLGGEKIELTVKVVANELANGESSKQIKNIAKVEADGLKEIISNEITNTIIPKQDSSNDPSIDTPEEGTHTISGVAWLDSNQDGKRDDTEQRMSNIPVILINAENGQIVTDTTTGKEKKQETNENGEYIFANLKPGKYMVVFLYDSANYGVTIYKQSGINDDKNSDTVQMNVVYEGTSRIAGVSDKLEIADENIGNIDMGLITSPKFDLKLDKVISKITVSNEKETKENEYKDTKLAKLDLNSKTINNTTIMIEYKIRVTNEGAIAGYAKKIVDYLPQDMKFTSELNSDWYTGDNGTNLYNASLANTLIQPGETKEITLLLTKKMTNNNTGIINNTAEIAESYNDLGLVDTDSTPANKVQNEDDYSNADAIIGIKTGEIYLYITLALITISLLGAGVYVIKKKVINKI